jgi:hypothetical protein
MARKSESSSLSELRERVALQKELNALLREEATLRERIARATSKKPSPPSRPPVSQKLSSHKSTRPSPTPTWMRPRDSRGRFLKKELKTPAPTKAVPPVLNWKVKVPVILEPSEQSDEMYDYASYSLWVVVDFDPGTKNGERKFRDMLKLYHRQFRQRDRKFRWLSEKWRVSRTTDRPRAYLTPEPS